MFPSETVIEQKNYLEMTIQLSKPAELHDLIRAFTALGRQFDEHIKKNHPAYMNEVKIYVRQLRKGSIIADLVPYIPPLIEIKEVVLIIDSFVDRYGHTLTKYLKGEHQDDASKSDLDDYIGQIIATARDPNGNIQLKSIEVEKSKNRERCIAKFDTKQSQTIENEVLKHKEALEVKKYEVLENVLLVFWQSNVKETDVGRQTGEKAIVEEASKKPLAVIYDSGLAEEKIKHETKDGDRNLYKLGFYVNCRVERLNSKPVAIRISEVFNIIELPDD